jgi:DNA repair exonuclease SbcCD ATPase subunit
MTNPFIDAFLKASKQLNDLENKILNSDEYAKLKEQFEEIKKKIEEFSEPVGMKKVECMNLEKQMMDWAVANKQTETDKYIVKFRETKKVNKERLFGVLDGDIDAFILIASITQKDLTEYAKENNDLKKPLEDCVEVVSRDPVSVTIL